MKEVKLSKKKKALSTVSLPTASAEVVESSESSCACPDRNDGVDTSFSCQAKEAFLNAKIETETKRATARENALEEEIKASSGVQDVLVDGESALKDKKAYIELQPIRDSVEEESTRAQTKEKELEEAISEAGKVDDVLVDGVSVVEDKVAKVDLQPLKDSIEEETERAKGKESELESSLASEASRATTKESELEASLNDEISAREKGDEESLSSAKAYSDEKTSEEKSRAEESESALDSKIDAETKRAKEAEDKISQDSSSAIQGINEKIDEINSKIPEQAAPTNKLADKDYVNSSLSTATATFRGTVSAASELKGLEGDLNDYAYVEVKDETTGQVVRYDRYKYSDAYSEETGNWSFEYTLNNSSFTSDQWKAITSGITEGLVKQIAVNEGDISKLSAALKEETEVREASDASLDTRISSIESSYIKKDGSVSMAGNLDLGTNRIINVLSPENDSDAANKSYVDLSIETASEEEQLARQKAIEAVKSLINDEAETRKSGDDSLQAALDNEITYRKDGDALTLTSSKNYTDEKTTALTAALNEEINERKSADVALENALKASTDGAQVASSGTLLDIVDRKIQVGVLATKDKVSESDVETTLLERIINRTLNDTQFETIDGEVALTRIYCGDSSL